MYKFSLGDEVRIIGNETGLTRDMSKAGVEGIVLSISDDGLPIVEYTFQFMKNITEFNEEDLVVI